MITAVDSGSPETLPFPEVGTLRVIELGNSFAVAAAGRILRQLGANVMVCRDRRFDDETTQSYLDSGKGTASFTAEEARPTTLREFDIVLESHQPTEDQAGIRTMLDGLHDQLPEVVVTSITPFGLTGPYADRSGNDHTVAALSGLAVLTPRDIVKRDDGSDQPPLPMPGNLVSNYSAVASVVATLAAIFARNRGVHGQAVDVSMLEAILPTVRREIAYYAYDASVASRFMRVWRLAPWGVKKCADGYFFVQVVEKHHWQSLVEMMGSPEWACDPALLDPIIRYNRRIEVDAGVEEWIKTCRREDLAAAARERKLPFAPVNRPEDVQHLPQMIYRDFFAHADNSLELRLPFRTRTQPW